MRKLKMLIGAVALTVGLQVSAATFEADFLFQVEQTGNPSAAQLAGELLDRGIITSANELGTLIYKINTPGGVETGAGLFDLDITTEANNLQIATLTYTGAEPAPALTFIVVKAANAYNVFDARDWDGEADIVVSNEGIFPGQSPNLADISNIQVYGGPRNGNGNGEPPARVPDGGGTLAMLGLALVGLASASRMRGRRK